MNFVLTGSLVVVRPGVRPGEFRVVLDNARHETLSTADQLELLDSFDVDTVAAWLKKHGVHYVRKDQ